jgi:hypothetical protein
LVFIAYWITEKRMSEAGGEYDDIVVQGDVGETMQKENIYVDEQQRKSN